MPPFHIKIIQETYDILWTFSSLLYTYISILQLMSLYFSPCLYTSKHTPQNIAQHHSVPPSTQQNFKICTIHHFQATSPNTIQV